MVQTVAIGVGAMPAAGGFTGVIPALEFLLPQPVILPYAKLVIWTLGMSIFGLIFVAILHKTTNLVHDLRFPSGTASALILKVLYNSPKKKPAIYGEEDTQTSP